MKITTLSQLKKFLETRIPTREALFAGDIGIKRAKYFMKLLGNPQNKIKVIHIAGTSGKGSTAHLMSHILQSQGFNVGLSISPHVFDIRERMQINNNLVNEKKLLGYFNRILPTIKQMETCRYGSPTFFEINVGLAFYMFANEKMDYVVMETGLGGTLDATNTITSKNKICIITKIGLDHTEILGKTIPKIASEKVGIIQSKNVTISINQYLSARDVIKKKCLEKNAPLHIIDNKNYNVISSTPNETVFDFNFNKKTLKKIRLGLIGTYQAENCSLALACFFILSQRENFTIKEKELRKALYKITIAGRMEIRSMKKNTLIIDGAHNAQKMKAFTDNLSKIYPEQKFVFLVAFKKGKDFKKMLEKIMPLAEKIFLTRFSTQNMDNYWSSVDNKEIGSFLKSKEFENFKTIENKKSDIVGVLKKEKKPIVITGSLYLVGAIHSEINRKTRVSSPAT